jgi:hypothetical protein
MLAPSAPEELADIGVELEHAACALCGAQANTPILRGRKRPCGVMARGNGRASLLGRVLNVGAGYAAAGVGLTDTMLGRRPM